MDRLMGTITIRCPIFTVFDYLSRIETLPSWDIAVRCVDWRRNEPVGLGTLFEATIADGEGTGRYPSMVIAYEPPYQIGWLSQRGDERESTRITLEIEGQATVMRIRRQLTSRQSDAATQRARLRSSLAGLQAVLEGGNTVGNRSR